jgi:hypothetical protein
MDWDIKVKMVELFENNSEELYPFLESISQEITSDSQAMEMFLECVTLSEVEISKNIKVYKSLILKEGPLFNSFRSSIRYVLFKDLVESIIKKV